ncbi:hypothetical protein [Alicyclobacillus sp. ALC3]|uniref:hypothetical protein n=1 Tax=Alicyclobacillus sp. ALC3 TaxID=2796143 RepID=UPI002377E731|nr:hypothetical protein [Alicyclobacillus sp. ALC3]WDL99187.1 hypothetical protein JC200_11400 [Alicyclobacillus sp. ALC3]
MIRIRCRADLGKLYSSASPRALVEAVEVRFEELREALHVSGADQEFFLDGGDLVVLEPADEESDVLRYLAEGFPEWGELDRTSDPPLLRFVVMFDNDNLDTVFTLAGAHPAVDGWITPYLES